MFEWADDLKLAGTDLYLDSRECRGCCFLSHAHSDHIALHAHAYATPETSALSEMRLGPQAMTTLNYGVDHRHSPDLSIRLLPAGHVLGSAMLYAENGAGRFLYTGDFKLRECLTLPKAEPCPADVLLTETTYGSPLFRFPPWKQVAAQLVELCSDALRAGKQPIVYGYALGKAQEICRILTDAQLPVTKHGAVANVSKVYERFGVPLGHWHAYKREDFHGPKAVDLRCRGVLLAPPSGARSAFSRGFKNSVQIMMSGWGLQKNAKYRYGVDHVLPLSDHADFDELLELVEIVRPKKVYGYHGFPEFMETLKARGVDAEWAEPDKQLALFP